MSDGSNSQDNELPDAEITVGNYRLDRTIGQGTYGKVAVKVIDKSQIQSQKQVARLQREIRFLKLLHHPHIVKVHDVIEENDFIYIVMEYAAGGELFDYIVACKRVKEKEARMFFRMNAVIHRDLKPENLLLDENRSIKIIDFGFGNNFTINGLLDTFCGSPFYAAPEMILGKKYEGPEVDMWSLGVILFALLCGHLPFDDDNMKELYKKISSGSYKCPDYLLPDARHLIDRLITVDPKKRATLSEVLSHPWVNKDYSAPPPSYIPARRAITQNELSSDIIARLQIFGYKVADINAAFTEQDLTKPNPIRATYHLLSEMVARERAKAITEQRRMLSQMTISESPIGKSENAQIASSLSTIPNTVQDHRIISSPGDTTKQNLDIMANQRADFAKMSSRRQSAPFVNMAPAPSNRRVSLKDDIKTFASKWLLGNTTATGSLPQKVEVYQITDILDEFHIRYKKESEFTLICETEADVNLSKPGQIVMFQIDLKSGVNFKRIAGGVWNYKKICNKIQNKVKDQ